MIKDAAINIPTPRTPIIGRERELVAAIALLSRSDVPLITLIGPGGVGKTRLAIELARSSIDVFADGVFFVPLANISDPSLLSSAIAQVADISPVSGEPTDETVQHALYDQQALLVLDNFEQIVSASPLVTTLLEAAPGVKIVATSRSPLRIHGEHEFPVAPLALSPDEVARRSGALALFAERANAVDPTFQLTPENAATVAQICERLDGLPLAIELAAARMKLLTPSALLARMEDGLSILASGARDAPRRQQTLTDAIQWSYGLLTDQEQWLFRHLSVFAAGFTLEAAEAIAHGWVEGDSPFEARPTKTIDRSAVTRELLEYISALVEQSLLRRMETPSGQTRIAMLHTIREFAREQLDRQGETRTARLAHAFFFSEQLAEAHESTKGPHEVEWMAWFSRETDNLRAALYTLIEYGQKETALLSIGNVSSFWAGRIGLREIDLWVHQAFQLPGDVSAEAEFLGLFAGAWSKTFQGDLDAGRSFANQALIAAERTGSARNLVRIRNLLGGIAVHAGDVETAWSQFNLGVRLASEIGSSQVQGLLHNLGIVEMVRGDLTGARATFQRAVENAREHGDRIGEALCTIRIAQIQADSGDLLEAARLNRSVMPTMLEASHTLGLAEAIGVEGVLADREGDEQRALRYVAVSSAIEDSLDLFDVPLSNGFANRYVAIEKRLEPSQQRRASKPTQDEIDAIVREILCLPDPDPGPEAAEGREATSLTPREIEIVRLIAKGRSNQEMANDLFISLRTVQTHVSNILAKLELSSRAAVAAYAVRAGIE
jgi:predicted ATPase/DNA-binding NarL/FixJ family response regulator